MTVPHLTTALSGPLLSLERQILEAQPAIEHWLRTKWQEHSSPFYASVDLRNAGFKLAPVDTNLFPGGFNNLAPEFMPLCVQAVMVAVEKICPDARGILLVPENHTRNTFYLQNVATLQSILRQAGMKVRIGTLLPDVKEPTTLELPSGAKLVLEPIVRNGRRVGLDGFDPCTVLLNNDLSAGIPPIFENIDQPIIPPLHAGWSTRRKSHHFTAYDEVASEFGKLIGIDPWLINPHFGVCGEINFHERTGEECLARWVDGILEQTREKYREYDIRQEPFVIVKADAGTYGMGIMSVKSADEVVALTFESVNDAVAEPVVYMIDHFVVGGFYRVHTDRGIDENLNAPGMHFVPLAFESSCSQPDPDGHPNATPNRFYAYGVVARLALLAAALEIERTAPDVVPAP